MASLTTGYDFVPEFRASLAVKQKLVIPETISSMDVRFASYPAAAQVTIVKDEVIKFRVVLDVPESHAAQPWQIVLWHCPAAGEWCETQFARENDNSQPTSLHGFKSSHVRLCYTAGLRTDNVRNFTIKYRNRFDEPWRWIRDEHGLSDGVVLQQLPNSPDSEHDALGDIIIGLNPHLTVKSAMSQSPGTRLWEVKGQINGAVNDRSANVVLELGRPWQSLQRWFALVRLWSPWLVPRHGKTKFDLNGDAMMCAFLGTEGRHLVLLGMSDLNNGTTVLRGKSSGTVELSLRNDSDQPSEGMIIAVVGDTFDNALAAAMYHARSVLARTSDKSDIVPIPTSLEVRPQWRENWYDGLGYCTWNAIGPDLSSDRLEDSLDDLARHNIQITNLIIDDGWQDVNRGGDSQYQHGWNSFEADPQAFPGGLQKTISKIRKKHPHIQHVAVWHALLGYWGGLSPNGSLAQRYTTTEVARESSGRPDVPLGGMITVVDADDISRFYNDFYSFLEDCGIDGVKTDVQFMIEMLQSAVAKKELINEYLDAWIIAGLRHFSLRSISCMSQVPQIMFHQQMPRNRPAIVLRNSDDFFPHEPAAHPWHLWANAHNALLTQHLNVLPDWDMFQTDHEYGGFHAAARCISGSPIYITDVPGRYDLDIINQISGMTTMGKTVIFRPSVVGRSLDHYADYHDNVILKVGSYNGASGTGTPLLGVFNVASRPLTELIPLSRLPGTVDGLEYIIRSHTSGRISDVMKISSPAAALLVNLEVGGYDILTAFPVRSLGLPSARSVQLANLGLIDKMTGAAAIMMNEISMTSNQRAMVDTRLMAFGTLGIYISTLPSLSIENDFMITILGQPVPQDTVSASGYVLSINVAMAWKRLGLTPGWSNEVGVRISFNTTP